MKKLEKIVMVIVGLLICAACTTEDLIEEEPTESEKLVQNSPYEFDEYDIFLIGDDGGSGLEQQEIEDDMNNYLIGVVFTFDSDSSGSIYSPEDGTRPFTWSLNAETLTTINTPNGETDIYRKFKMDDNQISFSGRVSTVHGGDLIPYTVAHFGSVI